MADEIKKLRYSHEAVADLILANPTLTHKEIGELLGRSSAWAGYVMNSDAFKDYLRSRRDAVVDPVLTATVEDRLKFMTHRSLEIVAEKLADVDCDANFALRAAEAGTKALGYGARDQGSNNQGNYVVVLPEKVRSPQDWADLHKPPTHGAPVPTAE